MPSLLVIDDDRAVIHSFRRIYNGSDIEVHSAGSGSEGLAAFENLKPEVLVLDIMLPDSSGLELFHKILELDRRVPVVFITAYGASATAIEAIKLGALDYLLKPLEVDRVREVISQAFKIRRYMDVPVHLTETTTPLGMKADPLVGRCEAMQEVYKAIGRVAPQSVTVLIRGESGTGKELVARAIYQHSPRSKGRFMAVNCAAIPETLLESELFGHEKGSFTGADSRRIGRFEQCNGGILFLDEVGDMTPLMQSKVLRVLQEQRFERVGGNQTIETDVAIITATNRDLEKMVRQGEFRADLYYRLNGFTIKIPALRDRLADLPLLIEHFLHIFNRELGKEVDEVAEETMKMLHAYPWPGNVRELQSILKQSLLRSTGRVLLPEFLPPEILHYNLEPKVEEGISPLDNFIEERIRADSNNLHEEVSQFMERVLLRRVLREVNGNQSKAALILGITRGSLRGKIRQLGITIHPEILVQDDEAPDSEEQGS